MSSIGVLIVVAVIGAYICGKSRFPGGTVVFSLFALILFIGTPAGSWLPGGVASFLTTVNDATTPALTHSQNAGVQR